MDGHTRSRSSRETAAWNGNRPKSSLIIRRNVWLLGSQRWWSASGLVYYTFQKINWKVVTRLNMARSGKGSIEWARAALPTSTGGPTKWQPNAGECPVGTSACGVSACSHLNTIQWNGWLWAWKLVLICNLLTLDEWSGSSNSGTTNKYTCFMFILCNDSIASLNVAFYCNYIKFPLC